MHEEQIESIKQAIRELMQYIQKKGSLSEEEKLSIAQALDHAANRITQLRQEQQAAQQTEQAVPPPTPPQEQQGQIPSSNINRFAYDPKTRSLLVKFQGDYPQENGPVYQYSNVPEQVFEVFRRGAIPAKTNGSNRWGRWWRGKSPSLGASFYEAIRQGGYPYQRVA